MTLLDAPEFNAARDRRIRIVLYSTTSAVITLLIVWWLIAGHPLDWPWHWDAYISGRSTINNFFSAVEHNDQQKAYGIWFHDSNWQQHPAKYNAYSYSRFEQDWGPNSPDNEYGPIHSHRIAAERYVGNVLVVGLFINGRKSDPVFLAYDPRDRTLSFSPIQLYLGP